MQAPGGVPVEQLSRGVALRQAGGHREVGRADAAGNRGGVYGSARGGDVSGHRRRGPAQRPGGGGDHPDDLRAGAHNAICRAGRGGTAGAFAPASGEKVLHSATLPADRGEQGTDGEVVEVMCELKCASN